MLNFAQLASVWSGHFDSLCNCKGCLCAIVEKLAPRFITVPCGNELEAVVEDF